MSRASALRRSPFSPAWSLVAERRSERPMDTEPKGQAPAGGPVCPFCQGNEHETEREVFAVRPHGDPDGPGWTIRVVPNRFPALTPGGAGFEAGGDLYAARAARGFHEVVIDSPDHECTLATLPVEQIELLLRVYQMRLRVLSARRGVRTIALFRNEGRLAGASQVHPHSQILALPLVPALLASEVAGARAHVRRHGQCRSCAMLAREKADGRRLVLEASRFMVVTSFAPRFPGEAWILPARHGHDFADAGDGEVTELAQVIKRLGAAYERAFGAMPMNLVLQTAPVRANAAAARAFHWRFEILPRLSVPSGFELGFGVFIVSHSPESAAARLRDALS